MELEDGAGPTISQGLIKQTKEEKLLVTLRSLKQEALAEAAEEKRRQEKVQRQEDLARVEKNCASDFADLCASLFGINARGLRTLDDEKLFTLFQVVEKRAKRVALWQKAFVLVPVTGWVLGLITIVDREPIPGFTCWRYTWALGKLRKTYGDDYTPRESLKRLIGK